MVEEETKPRIWGDTQRPVIEDCPTCGYAYADGGHCPECGWTIPFEVGPLVYGVK